MDNRLFRIAGFRPHRLTKHDVPTLASAIVASMRQQANVQRLAVREVLCVRLWGTGFDILVRSEDWTKVVSFLQDSSFDPLIVPVSQAMVSNRSTYYDASVLDRNDSELRDRVIRALEPLFTVDFP